MKIFVSWSGDTSHKIAMVFREWLPSVIQEIIPYVSSEDIDKGSRWSSDISSELDNSSFGIICVTKENISAPWINFEAGALSKQIDKAYVSPFLFGVKRSEVNGPLLQFQSTIYDKEDLLKLIKTINKKCGNGCLEEGRLEKIFEVWWPKLQEELDKLFGEIPNEGINKGKETVVNSEADNDILEEILELLRNQHKLLRDPEMILPPSYLKKVITDRQNIAPAAFRDLESSFNRLNQTVKKYDEIDSELFFEEIKICMESLRKPIKYMISHSYNNIKRSYFKEDDDVAN